MNGVAFRAATRDDLPTVVALYLRARKALRPIVPLVHDDDDVRNWLTNILCESADIELAIVDGEIVGLMATATNEGVGWIEQLYLDPQWVNHSIGSRFVGNAKQRMGAPLRLYSFPANHGACRFYERHGFRAIWFGDGSGNEEGQPDVLYEWSEE